MVRLWLIPDWVDHMGIYESTGVSQEDWLGGFGRYQEQKNPGKKTGCTVLQLSIAAEGDEDISNARMINAGIEAFIFLFVTAARTDTANGSLDKRTLHLQMDISRRPCTSSSHRFSSSLSYVVDRHAQLRWHNTLSSLNLATSPLLYFSVSLIQPAKSTYPVLVTHVQIPGRTLAQGPYNPSRVLS